MNRGRITSAASAYSPPTVPVSAKCAYMLIGDDIVDASTWAPRKDTLGAGSPTIVNGSVNASGWPTPERSRKTITLNGTTAYLRINGLAAMATADDAALEIVALYKVNVPNNPSALLAWSSTSSTTPKRVLLFTTGPYRVAQQATTSIFSHNATNTLQQMVRMRLVNNGAGGNGITIWRNEELDPGGTLTNAVGAQAVNTFCIGAQDNGGVVTNFASMELFALWVRDPNAAQLTDDEGLELHNFFIGAYDTAPLYSGSTQYLLLSLFGQSNAPCQGLGTGAVTGMPDATAKMFVRSLNNDADDPIALTALDRRPGANRYSSSMQWWPSGSFAMQHHVCGVGKGATNAGSDWGGGAGAGPANSLQGLYSTNLYSEVRRMIFATRARFGGSPIVQCVWQQGENDAAAGAVVAGQYGANWTQIKTYIRNFWARLGVANVPIHVVQLNPNQTGGGIVLADLNTIRAAMVTDDSGDANEYLVETNDITALAGDNLHYINAANSYGLIGTRLITSIKASDGRL